MLVLPDWYVCMSVALNAEEDEQYNQQLFAYMAAGGDPKKFPKRRKPYTVPAKEEIESPHKMILGALGMPSGPKITGRRGNVEEFAKSRGLKKVFQMPDGTFVDDAGNKVEPTAGSVFVKKGGQ